MSSGKPTLASQYRGAPGSPGVRRRPWTFRQAWIELDSGRYKAQIYRAWHAACRAGLDRSQVLATLPAPRASPAALATRGALADGIRRGLSLRETLQAHPQVFVPFEAALLTMGEETGQLQVCLDLLCRAFEAEGACVRWVKRKLRYPLVNLVLAAFIVPFPLAYANQLGAYFSAVSTTLLAAAFLGGIPLLAVARWFQQHPRIVQARLLRVLALCVDSGLGLERSVALAAQASGSSLVVAHVGRFTLEQIRTQPLSRTFEGCALVSPYIQSALAMADQTASHGTLLKRLADQLEEGL